VINGRRTILAGALTLWSLLAGAHVVQPLPVKFEFPDRDAVSVAVTYDEVVALTHEKLPYTIEFWLKGALAKAELKYSTSREGGHARITEIAGVGEGARGEWIYYVNGIRSIYHINTQTAKDVHSIRFVFKPRRQ